LSNADRTLSSIDTADAPGKLEEGRACYARRAWARAYESLSLADRVIPLEAPDLERLAMAAYLVGRDEEYLSTLDRTHRAYLEAEDRRRAARCAFWLGLRHMFRGEAAQASGWLARAGRLLEREPGDCVERGYLLLPVVEQYLAAGKLEAAYAAASDAVEIGERFGETDLVVLARHLQGQILLRQDEVAKGLTLLDEAMIAVTAGELSPLVTGLVYCSVIEGCQHVFALARAREWTAALTRWCDEQPELVSFTGRCLVHRAEILQVHGAWPDAIEEARRAGARCSAGVNQAVGAAAFYQQGEVHRLRGEFAAAEEAYRNAHRWGLEPQPGLALLRMAQGRTDAALAAIRRVASSTTDPMQRSRLLPALIDIQLANGAIEEARRGCAELEDNAKRFGSGLLHAIATQARGAVELADGDAQAALRSLRSAWQEWQAVEAPYAAARVRVLVGQACRVLGDEDGCAMELDAARIVFEQLGAAPDLAHVRTLAREAATPPHGLTAREWQVLRLVAAGKTNKAIAKTLFLSEKTVDRHVSNIFTKLDVSSRAAATAYAYEQRLL
jgi:ATP/maltotriose-dependent transcriptional regulator MalT